MLLLSDTGSKTVGLNTLTWWILLTQANRPQKKIHTKTKFERKGRKTVGGVVDLALTEHKKEGNYTTARSLTPRAQPHPVPRFGVNVNVRRGAQLHNDLLQSKMKSARCRSLVQDVVKQSQQTT